MSTDIGAQENYNRFIKACEFSARLAERLLKEGYKEARKEIAELKAEHDAHVLAERKLMEAERRVGQQATIAYMNGAFDKDTKDAIMEVFHEMSKYESMDDAAYKTAALNSIAMDFQKMNLEHMMDKDYPKDMAQDAMELRSFSEKNILNPDEFIRRKATEKAMDNALNKGADKSFEALTKSAAERAAKSVSGIKKPDLDIGLDKVR